MKKLFVKLTVIAQETGLPKAQIKRLAQEGKLPALRLAGRLRFNPKAVQVALDRLAEEKAEGNNGR